LVASCAMRERNRRSQADSSVQGIMGSVISAHHSEYLTDFRMLRYEPRKRAVRKCSGDQVDINLPMNQVLVLACRSGMRNR
jgi:hypothetical protein